MIRFTLYCCSFSASVSASRGTVVATSFMTTLMSYCRVVVCCCVCPCDIEYAAFGPNVEGGMLLAKASRSALLSKVSVVVVVLRAQNMLGCSMISSFSCIRW